MANPVLVGRSYAHTVPYPILRLLMLSFKNMSGKAQSTLPSFEAHPWD